MRRYWFCARSYYELNWEEIDRDYEFVGYSEFNSEGVPGIVELKLRVKK